MNEANCKRVQAELHAYRRGELAPLSSQLFERHLEGCGDCRGELTHQARLEDAAKVGPAPLSDVRKRQLLDGVHMAIAAADRADRERSSRPWGVWIPMAILAPAAIAAVVVLAPLTNDGYVSIGVEGGVTALADSPEDVTFRLSDAGPRLQVRDGSLMVAFARPAGSGPLRIETPHGEVVVRGTALVVEVDENRSSVNVQRGWVEAITDGERRRIDAGMRAIMFEDRVTAAEPADQASVQAVLQRLPPAPREHPVAASGSARDRAIGKPTLMEPTTLAPAPQSTLVPAPGSAKVSPRGRNGRNLGSGERPAPTSPRPAGTAGRRDSPSRAVLHAQVSAATAAWARNDTALALESLEKLARSGARFSPEALEDLLDMLVGIEKATAEIERELTGLESRARSDDASERERALEVAVMLTSRLRELAKAQGLVQSLLASGGR